MPVIEGVGQSDNTYLKQDTLSDLLLVHTKVAKGILRKVNAVKEKRRYLYIDLNAGSGFYNQIKGSPIVFLETISRRRFNQPFTVQLCEIDQHSSESLLQACRNVIPVVNEYTISEKRTSVIETENGIIKVINRDNAAWVNETVLNLNNRHCPDYIGSIYSDPNGCETFDNLIKLSNIKCLFMVDVIMHISATTIKRVCCANSKAMRLMEGIKKINKRYWWIRQPYGPFQWTFMIGTNWRNFPNLQTCGFYNIESDEGQKILNYTNYTRREVEQLFQQQNIKPIVNTSNTRLLRHLGNLSLKEQTVFAKSAKQPDQLRFII